LVAPDIGLMKNERPPNGNRIRSKTELFCEGVIMNKAAEKQSKINYLKGDATKPIFAFGGDGKTEVRVIFHICNDIRRWGKGFVIAVSDRWPHAKNCYLTGSMDLGSVTLACVDGNLHVANLIAQRGITPSGNVPPIRYDAFRDCLIQLASWAQQVRLKGSLVSFHGPRMGAGLAGGDWKIIEGLIEERLGEFPVYIYDL